MNKLSPTDITEYVESNIGEFHQKRLQRLHGLKLNAILKRKNPYLFKAKNIYLAQDLVKDLLDAYLSSQEETIFGDFLEGLAIFINTKVFNGYKSAVEGVDVEFEKDGTRYIVAIKSGPNWGNSSQIRKMREDFTRAGKVLRTSNSGVRHIVAINGCCYGKENQPDKGDYHKYCGQQFWEFVSGNPKLYTDIIEPLGHRAKEQNTEFQKAYAMVINTFTQEFAKDFCKDGTIDWQKLVEFNSARK